MPEKEESPARGGCKNKLGIFAQKGRADSWLCLGALSKAPLILTLSGSPSETSPALRNLFSILKTNTITQLQQHLLSNVFETPFKDAGNKAYVNQNECAIAVKQA